MDKDSLTLLLAQGVSIEEIGRRFSRHPSTVAYWMAKFGLEAPNREKYAAKGGIEREELEELVERGLSIGAIAETLGVGKSTVRHWLGRYDLRTVQARNRETASRTAARHAGLLTATLSCARHGETDFVLEGRGYWTRARSGSRSAGTA